MSRDLENGSGSRSGDSRHYDSVRVETTYDSSSPSLNASSGSRQYGGETRQGGGSGRPERGTVVSRGKMFFWGLGITVLMVWIFALGVLVGRGTIFQNYFFKEVEERLPVNSVAEKSPPAVQMEGDPPALPTPKEAETQLTFYDTVKREPEKVPEEPLPAIPPAQDADSQNGQEDRRLADEPGGQKKTAAKVVEEKTSPPAKEVTAAAEPSAPPAPVEKKEPKKQVLSLDSFEKAEAAGGVMTVMSEQSPTSPPQRRDGESYTVQVEIAKAVPDAERAVQRLKSKGLDAYYYQVDNQGKKYFRVRVGRFRTREEAQKMMDKLAGMGGKNMFISRLSD